MSDELALPELIDTMILSVLEIGPVGGGCHDEDGRSSSRYLLTYVAELELTYLVNVTWTQREPSLEPKVRAIQ